MRRAASSPPARSWACDPRVAVRVNPDFAVRGSGMRMGGGPQQFGVDAEQVPQLLRELDAAGVDLLGFHVFAGSQNLSADLIVQAQTRTVELVLALAADAPQPVRYVNLGGGFGVPYFPQDQPLDIAAVAANLTRLVEDELAPALPDADLVIELGRYLVAEAGVYVTRVVDRKVSRGSTYLVVDGGMHHQLAASGNLGQVIRRNYPLAVGGAHHGGARGDGHGRRVPLHPAGPAGRPRRAAREPTSATSSSSSRPAPTG